MNIESDSDIGVLSAIGPGAHPPKSKYDRLIEKAKTVPSAKTIVVHPCDENSLRGAIEAAETGIIAPILVGPAARITRLRAITISISGNILW